MPKYTPAECEARRQRNKRLGCIAPQSYWDASAERLSQVVNGIGSDKYGSLVVGVSTWILSLYIPAADIHDWCWTVENDGTKAHFHQYNWEFQRNCHFLADSTHILFGWFRREARKLLEDVGTGLYDVVNSKSIGWPIWWDAAVIEPGPERLV